MSQLTIEDPVLYETKNVDSSGKVYLGKEFANSRVKLVIEEIEEAPTEE